MSDVIRPVIGITCPSRPTKWANWDLDAVVLPTTYHKMIIQCGGIPLLIPPGCSSEVIHRIDGLLISGGPDIDPRLYGQENGHYTNCLLYTSPSPRDLSTSRMPSSA